MLVLAASLLAFSCKLFDSDDDDDSASGAAVVQSEPNASPDGKAYLRVGISHGGAARTINPADVSTSELEDIVLSGTKSGSSSEQTLAEANSIADFPESVALDPGTWDFTLSARLGGAAYSAELTDIAIRKDETTSVTFSLEPVAGQTQYGGLAFTLTLSDDSVKSAKITLTSLSGATVDEQTVSVSGASISYARSKDDESKRLETGAYRLSIRLYGDEFDGTNEPKLLLNTYKAVANIAAGRTSTGRDTLSGIEKIYSVTFELNGGEWAGGAVVPESFTRKSSAIALPAVGDITKSGYGFAGWYTSADFGGEAVTEILAGSTGNRTFWAKWIEPVLYVASDGDDSKDALSEEGAVKTLAQAVTLLKSYSVNCGMGGESWKICLKGSVNCGETVDIGTADAASLTVEGLRNSEESASQDFLLGTSEVAAITIASGVPVTFYKVCVKGGKGGIIAKGAGKLSVKNSAIMQNTGSGIKIEGDGDVDIYKSLIGGTDSTNGNTAESGAGIHKTGSGTLTITDSTIAYNTASGSGGGIYVGAGTATLGDGVKIESNEAQFATNSDGGGGGIFVGSGASLYLYGSATVGKAGVNGGAAADESNHSNTAPYGAGIFSYGNTYLGYSAYTSETENTPATLTGGVYGNYATKAMGGVLQSGSELFVSTGAIAENGSAGNYGGVGARLSATVTMTGGEICRNAATGYLAKGGGIGVSNSKFTMANGKIYKNAAVGTSANYSYGGGIEASNATIFIYGKAVIGGTGDGDGNTADRCGGAMYLSSVKLYLGYSSETQKSEWNGGIYGNTANIEGGGIYLANAETQLIMNSGKISGNTVTNGRGGGVYSIGTFTMSGGEISKNTATTSGGGVYNSGTMLMYGSAVIGNSGAEATATSSSYSNTAQAGGGIYNTGSLYAGYSAYTDESDNSPAGFTGGVYQNYASSGYGGGICSIYSSGTLKMRGGTVNYNRAENGGGGIFASGAFTATGITIKKNTANHSGGGVYTNGASCAILKGCTIQQNVSSTSAYYGGGIFAYGTGGLTLEDTLVSLNTSSGSTASGQLAVWENCGTVTLVGSTQLPGTTYLHNTNTKVLTIGGKLTAETPITNISLASYTAGRQVLTLADGADTTLAAEYEKFGVKESGWVIDSAGRLQKALTVTFNTNGGSAVDSQTVMAGSTATEPDAPTKTDYLFMGWHTSADAKVYDATYDFGTAVTGDLTLYAAWMPTTVSLKTGSNINTVLKNLGANSTATAFAQSSTAPTDGTTVQYLDDEENVPVWLDGTTIYYYAPGYTDATPKKKIFLNENSGRMFSGCEKLVTIDVTGFDTANVTNMGVMFSDCTALTTIDVSGFDTSKVTDMASVFYNCKFLTALDVSGWDTSAVTTMDAMFFQCFELTTLGADNVKNWNTANVTTMHNMFYDCNVLAALDVSGWDTRNVYSMEQMFYGCNALTVLDVSGFDTSSVISMSSLFSGCKNVTSLDVSNFNTSKVTKMEGMFKGCEAVIALDVSGFNTSKVTTMESMFESCTSLTTLDVSSFDTENVTTMKLMFASCSSLTTIYASDSFKTTSSTISLNMFLYCSNLVGGAGTRYSKVDATYARIDGANPGYFTAKP